MLIAAYAQKARTPLKSRVFTALLVILENLAALSVQPKKLCVLHVQMEPTGCYAARLTRELLVQSVKLDCSATLWGLLMRKHAQHAPQGSILKHQVHQNALSAQAHLWHLRVVLPFVFTVQQAGTEKIIPFV